MPEEEEIRESLEDTLLWDHRQTVFYSLWSSEVNMDWRERSLLRNREVEMGKFKKALP